MISRYKWGCAAIMVAIMSMSACDKKSEPHAGKPVIVHVDVDEEKVDVADHYLEIDRRSLIGVDKASAGKALAGDGPTAVAIGNAFADANHITEARFWYRIAAENGDAIGMAHMAIATRELECRRANYWLSKALAKGGLGKSETSMRRSLKEYEASCK